MATSKKEIGGASAHAGFDVQKWVAVIKIIDAMTDPDFRWVAYEVEEDFIISFGNRLDVYQVKNTDVGANILESCYRSWEGLSAKYPDHKIVYNIVSKSFSKKLRPLISKISIESKKPDEIQAQHDTLTAIDDVIHRLGLPGDGVTWLSSFRFEEIPCSTIDSNLLKLVATDKIKDLFVRNIDDAGASHQLIRIRELLDQDLPLCIFSDTIFNILEGDVAPSSRKWSAIDRTQLEVFAEEITSFGERIIDDLASSKADHSYAFDDAVIFVSDPGMYHRMSELYAPMVFFKKVVVPFFGDMFRIIGDVDYNNLKYYKSGGFFASKEDYDLLDRLSSGDNLLSFMDMKSMLNVSQYEKQISKLAERIISIRFPATSSGCLGPFAYRMDEVEFQMDGSKSISSLVTQKNREQADVTRYKSARYAVCAFMQEIMLSFVIESSHGSMDYSWSESPIHKFVRNRLERRRVRLRQNTLKDELQTTFFSALSSKLPVFRDLTLDKTIEIRNSFSGSILPMRRSIKKLISQALTYKGADPRDLSTLMDTVIELELLPDLSEFRDAISRCRDNDIRSVITQNSTHNASAGFSRAPNSDIRSALHSLRETEHISGSIDYLCFLRMLNIITHEQNNVSNGGQHGCAAR